ncbi:Uncharacterised protein [Serratia entomophila]|nr:Uncharacterised protein [Serratia entomophila]
MKLKAFNLPPSWPYGIIRFIIWMLTLNGVLFSIVWFYDRGFLTFIVPFCVFVVGCILYSLLPDNTQKSADK